MSSRQLISCSPALVVRLARRHAFAGLACRRWWAAVSVCVALWDGLTNQAAAPCIAAPVQAAQMDATAMCATRLQAAEQITRPLASGHGLQQ
jgi:hypothetical protein